MFRRTAKYAWINALPYGYNDSYGEGRTSTELIVDGEVAAQGFSASYRFTPDWQAHEEGYVVEIRIKDPDVALYHTGSGFLYHYPEAGRMGLYTGCAGCQVPEERGMLMQGSEPPVLTAQCFCDRAGTGRQRIPAPAVISGYYYTEDNKGNKTYTSK